MKIARVVGSLAVALGAVGLVSGSGASAEIGSSDLDSFTLAAQQITHTNDYANCDPNTDRNSDCYTKDHTEVSADASASPHSLAKGHATPVRCCRVQESGVQRTAGRTKSDLIGESHLVNGES